jgi:protein-S-isoprenylcysteine O-methyltransferase Ste14
MMRCQSSRSGRKLMTDRAEVKVLPPLVLLAALVAQAVLWSLAPARMLPALIALLLGLAVIAGSLALGVVAAREIVRAGTAIDVRNTTTALVESGIFQFSRNPVYLSMVVLVVGVGLALNSFWSLLLALPTGYTLDRLAIRPEEPYLEAKFGDAYRAYRERVPRWFSVRRALSYS